MDSPADTCRLINSFSVQRSAGQKALYCSIAARAIKISNALSISHLPEALRLLQVQIKQWADLTRVISITLSWRVCPESISHF